MNKLKNCMAELAAWNCNVLGGLHHNIKSSQNRLKSSSRR